MTVRGVARIVAVTAADFFRGVALCCRDLAADVADDLATLVHLNDAIRDAFTQPDDLLLAGRLAADNGHRTSLDDAITLCGFTRAELKDIDPEEQP